MLTMYASRYAPRLLYALGWMLGECLGVEWRLTQDASEDAHIAYGSGGRGAVIVPDDGALWQEGVPQHAPVLGELGVKDGHFSFDIFGAAFYLLARCEEYLPFTPDKHGRFPHTASVLHERGFLQRPIVDEWVERLRIALVNHCGLRIAKPAFLFQPTYDIDIAYAYHHKGLKRTLGGLFRDFREGGWGGVRARLSVLEGKTRDPYDAYDFLRKLHAETGLRSCYFFLAAQKPTAWDKNISPTHPAFRALVREAAHEGAVGMHPSYFSTENEKLIPEEKVRLESALGGPVSHSRQHFIRLSFPQTYRHLLAAGIRHDWSMGYPDAPGFRAGTGRSFLWYDLEEETSTDLRVHPFSFMDVTARDYLKLSAEEAFQALRAQRDAVRNVGSVLTTVFHNFSLGTARDWAGWREPYDDFVRETAAL